MEIDDTPSRISIGFPLGLALLVAFLLFICCFFCCCLHWDKLQSLFPSSGVMNMNPHAQNIQADLTSSHPKPGFPVLMMQQNHARSLPVLMPGDDVPKFIAQACPCQHPKQEKITIHVQKETPPPTPSGFCS